MIRPPPRSTLFPTRRSSDLPVVLGSPRFLIFIRLAIGAARTFSPAFSSTPVLSHSDAKVPADESFKLSQALRSEEHTSELQSPYDLVCRLLLEKKKKTKKRI